MKVSKILKILKEDGWYQVRQRGSHVQFKHSVKKGLVTVSFHKQSDIFREVEYEKVFSSF